MDGQQNMILIFKIKLRSAGGPLRWLLDSEGKGTRISRNVGTYMSTISNNPEELNVPSLDTFACITASYKRQSSDGVARFPRQSYIRTSHHKPTPFCFRK